jgi:uncharacterized integral membrane protein
MTTLFTMSTLVKIKWFLFFTLLLLVVIVAFQNLEVVEVRILLWDGKLTKALLVAGTTLIGFLMGLSARTLWHVLGARKRGKIGSANASPRPSDVNV